MSENFTASQLEPLLVKHMLFAENGIHNGTQFTSAEFQQLARQYCFEIVMSSPHYPCGHGSNSPNSQEDHPKVRRNWEGHVFSSVGTANNALEFQ